jgi:hypothetical protein
MNGGEPESSAALDNVVAKVQQRVRHYLDKTVVWPKGRWGTAFASLLFFAIRVKVREGFYLVAYALALYLLNILVGFLSPAEDPSDGITLPQNEQEFRPFTRKLPEFKAWVQAQKALALSIFATFFRVFDMPVFWPILLVYFLFLFAVTMRRQVAHMIQHKYVPFSWGKQSYKELTRGK